jgi:hypothetical protein
MAAAIEAGPAKGKSELRLCLAGKFTVPIRDKRSKSKRIGRLLLSKAQSAVLAWLVEDDGLDEVTVADDDQAKKNFYAMAFQEWAEGNLEGTAQEIFDVTFAFGGQTRSWFSLRAPTQNDGIYVGICAFHIDTSNWNIYRMLKCGCSRPRSQAYFVTTEHIPHDTVELSRTNVRQDAGSGLGQFGSVQKTAHRGMAVLGAKRPFIRKQHPVTDEE